MIVYRASELGSCTRRLTLSRVGYEPKTPPDRFLEYFARGDQTETDVKRDMKESAWLIFDEQEEVVLDITDEIKVVGHIDGKANDTRRVGEAGTTRLLEIKRMNDTYWNIVKDGGWYVDGLMEKYRWQISAYMHATGLEVMLVCRNGDTDEDLYLYAEEPFYSLNDIAARVLVVEGRARSFSTLDGVGECDSADYPCPFFYTHLDEREDAGEQSEEIEGLGIAYKIAKQREREAKESADVCRERLGVLLGDRDKLRAGRVQVTRFDQSRTRLDKRAAKADGIDLTPYETKSVTQAMRITVGEDTE